MNVKTNPSRLYFKGFELRKRVWKHNKGGDRGGRNDRACNGATFTRKWSTVRLPGGPPGLRAVGFCTGEGPTLSALTRSPTHTAEVNQRIHCRRGDLLLRNFDRQ